ncbi:MAG: Npun_F5749 family FMN-dependent PPOX-type flavoprotein [Phormidesmis sp.]
MPTSENAQPARPLEACQFEDEALAPWRSPLSRALHRNRAVPFCRYLQLATLKLDGTPANRTVVFRGFLNGTNALMFISDFRSEKTAQIQQNPNAEACWYFTKTREQFRLAGQLTLVTAQGKQNNDTEHNALTLQTARQNIWQTISDNARIQFTWPYPKAPRSANRPSLEEVSTSELSASELSAIPNKLDEQNPPEAFTLLILTPCSVDHLELRGDPQNRHLYIKDNGETPTWNVSAVNP